MAVTITNPQSRVVARATTLLIQWSTNYPYNAYEIQYRQAGTAAWSTFGRVVSSVTSASIPLSGLIDGVEYHYRVVLYTSNQVSGTTIYNGTQSSAAFSLVVTPAAKLGILKAKYGSKMVEVPVYADSNAPKQIKIGFKGLHGHVVVGSDSDPIATMLRLDYPHVEDSATLAERATFRDNGIPAVTYMQKDVRNTQYSYYAAPKYDKTYQMGYYIASYGYRYGTYYAGYYRYNQFSYTGYSSGGSYVLYCYDNRYMSNSCYSCGQHWSNGTPHYAYYWCGTYTCTMGGSGCVYGLGTGSSYSVYTTAYAQYYRYYTYATPTYYPYYGYYRYYSYYKATYYTYTTTYHYV